MTSRHEYPSGPVPAVGAIVFRADEVLLVKRREEPNRGRWSIPGGALEAGETVEAGAAREAAEETGVRVRPLRVVEVLDYIERDAEDRVRWHYVLLDVLCAFEAGEASPASDAANARFVPLRDLGEYDLTPTALAAIDRAARMRAP